MKKLMALLLAAAMVLSLAACGGSSAPAAAPAATTAPAPAASAGDTPAPAATSGVANADDVLALAQSTVTDADEKEFWTSLGDMNYDEQSDALYERNLGEFNAVYQEAKKEVVDLDLRYAQMAVAEAKLMESGVFIPVYGDGGVFAMNRLVPRSVCTVSWGIDEYKWHTALVCNELITVEDRAALTALWGAAEDEASWLSGAKEYLAEHGYTLNDTYNFSNSYELATWDVIATSYTSDSYFISCTYAPLMQYDSKGNQQPAMATSYDVNEDGTVYTFHIREGVQWVDQQGREVGTVTANDWVASMKHMIDNNDALGYLMTTSDGCGIKNYDAYINGEISDFSEVGVKAIDDYTLEYTLEAPFPAFVGMMGYACFAPLNESFYKSMGGTFSVDGDEYTAGNYGTSPANIAYNGAYLVSNFTEKNIISYIPNPAYFDPDAVNTPYVNWYFNDGSDPLRAYNEAKEGTISGCSFNSSSLVQVKLDKPEGQDATYFDLYNYTTTNSATTYCGWINMHRGTWVNFNDSSVGISSMTSDQAARTMLAMNNQHFRNALAFAFDRGAFNSTIVGEELKYAALKNSYITGNFMKLANDLEFEINGTAVTFPAGTYFGEIEQAQLDADGFPIKVWDPEGDSGAGSGDGFDGWFSTENAAKYMAMAVEELAALGVEVSAENPIHINVPYGGYSETSTNRNQAYKQAVEKNTNGMIVVDLVEFASSTDYTNAYYRNSHGNEANYDTAPGTSGWGPDYPDPQTFLDTIQPYGYMCKSIGLY